MNRAGAYGKCVLVMLYSKVIDDVDCCHWSSLLIGNLELTCKLVTVMGGRGLNSMNGCDC